MELAEGLHAFIWKNQRANNANAYLMTGTKNILIDPGHLRLFDHVRAGLEDLNLGLDRIDVVLLTHGHIDHMEALKVFRKPVLRAMSAETWRFIEEYGGMDFADLDPDFFLEEGDLRIGDRTLEVILTPGHSPGELCFYWPERKALFTGDVIFSQGIGRADLTGGNGGLLKESIRRLSSLDVEYLLPGHGGVITGRKNVRDNFRMVEEYWFSYLG